MNSSAVKKSMASQRATLQFHLSTAAVLMFCAAILLLINLRGGFVFAILADCMVFFAAVAVLYQWTRREARDWPLLIALIAAAMPVAFLVALYTLKFAAYCHLGRWPEPYVDDPKYIDAGGRVMDLLYATTACVMLTIPGAACCSMMLSAYVAISRPLRLRLALSLVTHLIGWAIFVAAVRLDPRTLDWFFD
jgi:hypothetical protein